MTPTQKTTQLFDEEGVTRFHLQFKKSAGVPATFIKDLNIWRQRLRQLQWIGQDPARYHGLGFGNVSRRYEPEKTTNTSSSFLVSGTQTGYLKKLNTSHYSIVTDYDVYRNTVKAKGPVHPSSESMTHGTLYDLDPSIQYIFHVHSPELWNHATKMGLPCTARWAPYGTPEMVREVTRLFKSGVLQKKKVFAMKGHLDGIISFGGTADEAGERLIQPKDLIEKK